MKPRTRVVHVEQRMLPGTVGRIVINFIFLRYFLGFGFEVCSVAGTILVREVVLLDQGAFFVGIAREQAK